MSHREIDVRFQGVPGSICAHLIGDVLVDPGPESSSGALLEALDGFQPRAIALTHIHLDHAGATGALLERWPQTDVWVHERGAPHLADPSRLVASATRIYGDQMERLWGRIVPVGAQRVRVLQGGEVAGGFRVEYTPGHASHHVAYLHEDSGIAFAGDVAGVRIGGGPLFAPTPPPDIDVEAWNASLDLIAAWGPSALAITHFGTFAAVEEQIAGVREALRRMAELARKLDAPAFEAAIEEAIGERPERDAYLEAMPPDTLHAGLDRYWRKRGERVSSGAA